MAVARPIPLAPPVMTATRPERVPGAEVITRSFGTPQETHGWLICEFGWHALTIGKGVGIAINSENHALPDGQGRATHDSKLNSNRTSSQPWPMRLLRLATHRRYDLLRRLQR